MLAEQCKSTRTGLQRRFLEHFGFSNIINFSTVFVNIRQPVICGVVNLLAGLILGYFFHRLFCKQRCKYLPVIAFASVFCCFFERQLR